MADVSLSDLGNADNPLPGLDASDYQGYGAGGNMTSPFDASSASGLGGLAALGIGAAGFGAILGRGESPLPGEYAALGATIPALQNNAQSLFTQGQTLTGQGTEALRMAQKGELTPEQQAQLGQYRTGLENKSRQMFYSMGRDPDKDTAAITQQANDDAQVNAMAQQQIQTTIQLGLGELASGSSFSGQALGYSNAASNILLQAGQAQLQQDHDYSKALTDSFSSIGQLFGAAMKALPALL